MNLPIIFVLAKSSLVSIFIWIAIMVFFAIMEFLKRAKKANSKIVSRQDPKQNPDSVYISPEREPINQPDKPVAKRSTVIGQDEAAFTNEDSAESATPTSAGDQQNAPKISIDSRDELKKAIIYHEIMDPKF